MAKRGTIAEVDCTWWRPVHWAGRGLSIAPGGGLGPDSSASKTLCQSARTRPTVWAEAPKSFLNLHLKPLNPSFTFIYRLLSKPHGEAGWGARVPKDIDAEAVLENCRALIDHIIAKLSAEKPFIDVSSLAELLLHLESAASILKRSLRTTPTRPRN
jgi:hypothetical protein